MSALALVARGLTLFRFAAIAPFACLLAEAAAAREGSLALAALYAAVAASDWLDGRLARRANAANELWGRLDAAADIAFNASILGVATAQGLIAPWPPLAVVIMGGGFLLRQSAPDPEASVEDRPGKLAGVFFYALVGVVTAAVAFPGVLGEDVVHRAGDAVALYAAGVVSARFAMSSWRR